MKSNIAKAVLVALPKGQPTAIDRVFCKLADGTFRAFVTFPAAGVAELNRGVVFYGDIARYFLTDTTVSTKICRMLKRALQSVQRD